MEHARAELIATASDAVPPLALPPEPGNVEPRYSEFLTFVGISVDERGNQRYLDSQLAYKRACPNAIEYLTKFGYSPEQAYLLLGAAPIEGRFRASSTCRTRARPCTCPPPSSTSTSARRPPARPAPTAAGAPPPDRKTG